MKEINICHLYPDLLNLYGDRGNILSLYNRCMWRNISAKIHNISIGDTFNVENYDIIFLGGGQDYEQEIIQKDILTQKANELKNGINNNKTVLAICGGYQMLGKYYINQDNKKIKYLGALDIYTKNSKKRMIGNLYIESPLLNGYKIIGFENHSGKTYLGNNILPLGNVIFGNGNNGEDKKEGCIYKNTFCSYSHGALLPKNPKLTDYIIKTTLSFKYGKDITLKDLDDSLEEKARKDVEKLLFKK